MDRPSAACGLRASMPVSAPTQLIAKPNSESRANPATALATPASGRQPTISAQVTITASDGSPTMIVEIVRPASTAHRAIGSVRNRSITPSLMSVATATATEEDENKVDWANRPDIRYVR